MVFVSTRLGEAFCSRSGLALEPCAKLWVPRQRRWNAGFMAVEAQEHADLWWITMVKHVDLWLYDAVRIFSGRVGILPEKLFSRKVPCNYLVYTIHPKSVSNQDTHSDENDAAVPKVTPQSRIATFWIHRHQCLYPLSVWHRMTMIWEDSPAVFRHVQTLHEIRRS